MSRAKFEVIDTGNIGILYMLTLVYSESEDDDWERKQL